MKNDTIFAFFKVKYKIEMVNLKFTLPIKLLFEITKNAKMGSPNRRTYLGCLLLPRFQNLKWKKKNLILIAKYAKKVAQCNVETITLLTL